MDFSKTTACVITGASRGIGQEITRQLADKLPKSTPFLLFAREAKNLDATVETISKSQQDCIERFACDFSAGDVESIAHNCAAKLEDLSAKVDQFLIVHNSGTTDFTLANDFTDVTQLRRYTRSNVDSTIVLNSILMKAISDKEKPIFLVNISSLCAVQAVGGLTAYCVVKAARDMFFKCYAVENPDVRVLNYSPGPIATDMLVELRKTIKFEASKESFEQLKPLTAEQTVSKFCTILQAGDYVSGAHIDYFDR